MKAQAFAILAFFFAMHSYGQFYPSSDATWCARIFSGERYRHLLSQHPDTFIAGHVYQLVRTDWCASGCSLWSTQSFDSLSTCLIRSTPDGKGYIRAFTDTTEYLVGDLAAQPGDTVNNILILGPDWWQWEFGPRPTYSVVVDSIVDFTRLGVTVRRHFIHEVSFWNPDDSFPYNFLPWRFYWQQGMGTSHGLILRMDNALSDNYTLECAFTGDTTVFTWYFEGPDVPPWGYPPGGPACCAPWNVGVAEHSTEPGVATENPSTGLFRLNATTPINVAVFDAQGRLVTSVPGNEIDLTAQPPGVYIAVVSNTGGRTAIRLVVMR